MLSKSITAFLIGQYDASNPPIDVSSLFASVLWCAIVLFASGRSYFQMLADARGRVFNVVLSPPIVVFSVLSP